MVEAPLTGFVRTGGRVSEIQTMNEMTALDPALGKCTPAHPSTPPYDSGSDSSDWHDSGRPRPAALDGRYVLGESLGRGGMARVYRAVDTVLDRTVAVKVFDQHAALPDGEARRAAEVHLLAGMNHPGLVMVYDAGCDESDPGVPFAYLVMELVDGTTLAQAIACGALPPPAVAAIGAQLAGALDHVHSHGVVHRDVKPANVLLAEDPTGTVAKLADFGVARLVDSTRLTVHGTTLGTPNYLSPEQATGDEITPASDIYSLGLVLLEALTGERAYPGPAVEAVVQRLHRQPDIPDRLGPGWTSLLTDMTASKSPARPDARSVQQTLRALADPARASAPIAVLPVEREPDVTTPCRRRRWMWPVGALGTAVVASAVVLAILIGGKGTPAEADVTVAGKLGSDLGLLEAVVPPELRTDLAVLSRAAANGDRSLARADLGVLASDLHAMYRNAQISDQVYREALTALAAVSADLRPRRAARATQVAGGSRSAHAPVASPSPKPRRARPAGPVPHRGPRSPVAATPADRHLHEHPHLNRVGHRDRHGHGHGHGNRDGHGHGNRDEHGNGGGHGDGHGQDGHSDD
jgi:hypothetical protein